MFDFSLLSPEFENVLKKMHFKEIEKGFVAFGILIKEAEADVALSNIRRKMSLDWNFIVRYYAKLIEKLAQKNLISNDKIATLMNISSSCIRKNKDKITGATTTDLKNALYFGYSYSSVHKIF